MSCWTCWKTTGPSYELPTQKPWATVCLNSGPSRSGIGRAFYCYCSGQVITILHAFVKKTQKTPKQELAKARQRLKEVKR